MDYLSALVLGIVQGIAEFLPISSSGHLVVAEALLDAHLEGLELNLALHVGTLGSILVIYRIRIAQLLSSPRMMLNVVVATLPVIVVGLFFKDFIERTFETPLVAGCGLIVTSGLLILFPVVGHGTRTLEEMTPLDAVVVGLFQAIAPLPGVSRSGSTICGALLRGVEKSAAADFSFLIAIPAISGAALLQAREIVEQGSTQIDVTVLLVGMLVSFVVGVVALKWLLSLIARGRLHAFAYYCATLGVIVITWQLAVLLG